MSVYQDGKIMECCTCLTANVITVEEFHGEGIHCTGCFGLFSFDFSHVNSHVGKHIEGMQT